MKKLALLLTLCGLTMGLPFGNETPIHSLATSNQLPFTMARAYAISNGEMLEQEEEIIVKFLEEKKFSKIEDLLTANLKLEFAADEYQNFKEQLQKTFGEIQTRRLFLLEKEPERDLLRYETGFSKIAEAQISFMFDTSGKKPLLDDFALLLPPKPLPQEAEQAAAEAPVAEKTPEAEAAPVAAEAPAAEETSVEEESAPAKEAAIPEKAVEGEVAEVEAPATEAPVLEKAVEEEVAEAEAPKEEAKVEVPEAEEIPVAEKTPEAEAAPVAAEAPAAEETSVEEEPAPAAEAAVPEKAVEEEVAETEAPTAEAAVPERATEEKQAIPEDVLVVGNKPVPNKARVAQRKQESQQRVTQEPATKNIPEEVLEIGRKAGEESITGSAEEKAMDAKYQRKQAKMKRIF